MYTHEYSIHARAHHAHVSSATVQPDTVIDHFTHQLDVSTAAAASQARIYRWCSSNSCKSPTSLFTVARARSLISMQINDFAYGRSKIEWLRTNKRTGSSTKYVPHTTKGNMKCNDWSWCSKVVSRSLSPRTAHQYFCRLQEWGGIVWPPFVVNECALAYTSDFKYFECQIYEISMELSKHISLLRRCYYKNEG